MRIKMPMVTNDRLFEISAKIDQLEGILELCNAELDSDVLSDMESELASLVSELSSQEKPQLHLV